MRGRRTLFVASINHGDKRKGLNAKKKKEEEEGE